ncbi:Uncharacterised protein [Salmonella enterica subsp. enterica serovar Bovismorbificans]|uniref:Uncharacterized protein n=1 Tax=Salmonella enterica subsp. enterica serovar Bovismorbificans TaxID=58097 RepID=A0A655C6L2_SALET|nr:Uncharacterised protein [Salmonella enterica subsp. enterica serovar Bovismorbificans]CNV31906.1 Uncharacterised protein [Salmonella enterica subsp. enterica serovar Bovismorbificans]CPR57501.1 Uncharacterised protein [Salmonella enterica subsp. enterica serovar Bovismorbificans]CPR78008.1 Uncharacterised protein [Salmonella enterica subsp. enterica serovar Bovismorbificans]
MTASREDHRGEQSGHDAVREVLQQIVHRLFSTIQRILYAPVHQRQVGFVATFVVVTLQYG